MTAEQDHEDHLVAQALVLVRDMREDVAAVHRTVRYVDRLELEQLCCVLAAMVPLDIPLRELAWWRFLAPKEDVA